MAASANRWSPVSGSSITMNARGWARSTSRSLHRRASCSWNCAACSSLACRAILVALRRLARRRRRRLPRARDRARQRAGAAHPRDPGPRHYWPRRHARPAASPSHRCPQVVCRLARYRANSALAVVAAREAARRQQPARRRGGRDGRWSSRRGGAEARRWVPRAAWRRSPWSRPGLLRTRWPLVARRAAVCAHPQGLRPRSRVVDVARGRHGSQARECGCAHRTQTARTWQ